MDTLAHRLAEAGIRVTAELLADPAMRRCLGFIIGEEETLDAFIGCYGGGQGFAECPVEAALRDGRIGPESAGEWRRLAERQPAEVAQALALLPPDPGRASRNFWADETNQSAYREHAVLLGLEEAAGHPDPDPERERLYQEHARLLGLEDSP